MTSLNHLLTATSGRSAARLSALVEPVASVIVSSDLPALPPDRRERAVAFVAARCSGLPSVMRFGVIAIAAIYRLILACPGGDGVIRWLGQHPLPIFGEYPRLIRSLAFALIWETWPSTRRDGSPS